VKRSRRRSPYVVARLTQLRAAAAEEQAAAAEKLAAAERSREQAFLERIRAPVAPEPRREVPAGSKLGIALSEAEAEALIAAALGAGRPNRQMWQLARLHGLDPAACLKARLKRN
jgi:hypothetical protein